jgi:hypothetical protein
MRNALALVPILLLPFVLRAADEQPSPPKVAAALVNLKGPIPLKEALQQLREQTGNAVADLRGRFGQEETNPTIALDLDKVPFWQAVDVLVAKANAQGAGIKLAPHLAADPKTRQRSPVVGIVGRDTLGPPPQQAPPVAYSGPFRVAVKRVAAVRDLENEALSSLTLTLEIACEPRFQPLLLTIEPGAIQAAGPDGQLRPAERAAVRSLRLVGVYPAELTVRLPLPPRDTPALAEFRMEFTALVPPEMLTFTLPAVREGAEGARQGVRFTLSRFRPLRAGQGVEWDLTADLTYPAGRLDLESHQTWALENAVLVLRRKGGKAEWRPSGDPLVAIDEGGTIRLSCSFKSEIPEKPDDWELIARAPAAPVKVPVAVSFRSLPLP